jgi:N-acetylglucosamine kinase-like BadF-type ATPase
VNAVGVDVGGGGIRIAVRDGAAVRENSFPGAVHLRSSIEPRRLAEEIASAVAAVPAGQNGLDVLAVGLTGYPALFSDPDAFARDLRQRCRASVLILAADALTSHIGALGFHAGAVISAGTGAVAIGTDFRGVWRRGDGWGYLVGDAGSGSWVGRHGIHAALRAADGRADGSPTLLALLNRDLGTPDQVIERLHMADATAHALATFAPAVAEAARAGDPCALQILTTAGRELGKTLTAVAAGWATHVSWAGGLFSIGGVLLETFRDAVREQLPTSALVSPRGSSAAGALALAERHHREPVADRWPFFASYP